MCRFVALPVAAAILMVSGGQRVLGSLVLSAVACGYMAEGVLFSAPLSEAAAVQVMEGQPSCVESPGGRSVMHYIHSKCSMRPSVFNQGG